MNAKEIIETIIMKEYDKRQLVLILQKIHAFKNGNLYLADLINDLGALVSVLTFEDQAWKDIFIGHWGDLEQVGAVALYREKVQLEPESQKSVLATVEILEAMVLKKLNDSDLLKIW